MKPNLKTGSGNIIVAYTSITQAKTEGQMIRGQPGLQREILVTIKKEEKTNKFLIHEDATCKKKGDSIVLGAYEI